MLISGSRLRNGISRRRVRNKRTKEVLTHDAIKRITKLLNSLLRQKVAHLVRS